MKSTFKIYFFLKKIAPRKNGSLPIMGRVTVDGKFVHFSTKLEVVPELWDQNAQRAIVSKGHSAEADQINSQLLYIASRLREIYRELQERELYVTAEKVRNYFFGHTIMEHTLLGVFRKHLADLEKSSGITISPATVQKYRRTILHLEEFLQSERKLSDIALQEIDLMFIMDLERYLRTVRKCNPNTTAKFIQGFRKIIIMAKNNGWITVDPFIQYKIRLQPVDRGYLTKEELQVLMRKKFPCERLSIVRDIFIFSCFTGLAYIDAKQLTDEMIQPGFDGKLWIITKRQKTNTEVKVPLLEIPIAIIEKYKNRQPHGLVLPVLSNQKMNAYLKEIGDVCNIKKNMTFHLARHTFATTITLTNGVPIESVSKMLGHTNIKTTQLYARIINEKISTDMANLANRISDMQAFLG